MGVPAEPPRKACFARSRPGSTRRRPPSPRATRRRSKGTLASGHRADSLWHKVLGLFANLKGEFKYAADRSIKKVEYRLERLSALIELVNQLLNECNRLLARGHGLRMAVHRRGIRSTRHPARPGRGFLPELFQHHRRYPVARHLHDPDRPGLFRERPRNSPVPATGSIIVPDTPVFGREHEEFKAGRAALQEALEARVSPQLFGARPDEAIDRRLGGQPARPVHDGQSGRPVSPASRRGEGQDRQGRSGSRDQRPADGIQAEAGRGAVLRRATDLPAEGRAAGRHLSISCRTTTSPTPCCTRS